MAEWGPGWWEPYASGEVIPFNLEAIAVAARALAVLVGDGRSYDEDPDLREAFAESARVAVGVYLEHAQDAADLAVARERLARGGKRIPPEEVLEEFGLDPESDR